MAGSLEGNKIVAAILTAGIIAQGAGVLSRIIYSPHELEKDAFPIQVASATGEAAKPAPEKPLPVLLAAADPKSGERDAGVCKACHNFTEGAGTKIGPDLWNVVGRDIASKADFSYSDALKAKKGKWTYQDLFEWLKSPRDWAPGTKMTFAGIPSPEKRADVIDYLRTLSEHPEALPEVKEEAAAKPAATGGGGGGDAFAALVASASADEGKGDVAICGVCHNFKEGAGAKIGPDLWNIVGRKIASKADFDYSDVLKKKEGDWTYDKLDVWLTDPAAWAPGTKMTFAGFKSEKKRAAVVAYLRTLSDHPQPFPEAKKTEAAPAAPAAAAPAAAGSEQNAGAGSAGQQAKAEPAKKSAAEAPAAAGGGQKSAAAPAGEQAAGAAEGQPATSAAGGGGSPFAKLVAEADPAQGAKDVGICKACHNFAKGQGKKIGPDLWDVVGRKIASVPDFNYSDALKKHEGDWTYDELDQWLTNPMAWAPGTRMVYAGMKDEKKRAAVVAYLRSLSDNPQPLPGAEKHTEAAPDAATPAPAGQRAAADPPAQPEAVTPATGSAQAAGAGSAGQQQAVADPPAKSGAVILVAAESEQKADPAPASGDQAGATAAAPAAQTAAAGDGGDDAFAALVASETPAEGAKNIGICKACHTFEKGGPNRIGPNLYGVVDRKIASEAGFNYSPALKGKEGDWTYDKLDAWLADPRAWAPGTRMIFAGIKDEKKRAAVVSYLRSLADNPAPLPQPKG